MKKLLKKLTAVVSAAAVALTCVSFDGTVGLTAAAETVGAFTVTGGTLGTDYTYADHVLTIKTDTPMTISGETTTDTIVVEKDKDANITLNGVNIDVSETGDFGSDIVGSAAFKIADDSKGDVTITLADGSENTLKGGYRCAGLQKNGEYSETLGKLTIQGGTGTLTATSNWGGAGIGGGFKSSGSKITITGGTVTASGGYGSAGIGGGYCGGDIHGFNLGCSGSYITITSGTVTANGFISGAGIGGGNQGFGSNIKITGGNVTANGNDGGAGIGGGDSGSGSNIKITGGTVTANGGFDSAGIGGGDSGYASNITITGGTVTANGGDYGAGIGGGESDFFFSGDSNSGKGSNITISGGTVTATGGDDGAGIGGGSDGSGSNITISGGSVKAVAGSDSEYVHDIGGGRGGNGAVTPTLADGTTKVFLYPIDTSSVSNSIVIDGVEYPTTHNGENSIYPYLSVGLHTVEINGTKKMISIAEDGTISDPATPVTQGEFEVYGGTAASDYDYSDGVLTIKTATPLMIKNANPNTATTDTIAIADGVSANIILDGVNIDVSGTGNFSLSIIGSAAFEIEGNSTGNVTITLADGSVNTLKSGYMRAGLQKNGGTSTGTLTIKGGTNGTGTLTAKGGYNGAGIGGGDKPGSNITISGGTVTATGGEDGAGIGGGNEPGSNITISGGTVTANGGDDGAGIGGGSYGSGSDITITGGTVTATGGIDGAGIGGGKIGSGSNITISGGSVKAVAGTDANAIGGGSGKEAVTPTNGENNVYLIELDSAETSLTIDGKSYPINHGTDNKVYVYLTEGQHTIEKDGISTTNTYIKNDNKLEKGGSEFTVKATNDGDTLTYGTDYTYPASTGVLTIKSDKAVTIANADKSTATTDTIVVEKNKNANITFDGVNIDVSGTDDSESEGLAAFEIQYWSLGDVTITLADGSENTLKSGYLRAGLEKNGERTEQNNNKIGKLTIKGTGKLTATGGEKGAGIGGKCNATCSDIEISSGNVIANGGDFAAGIGGGFSINGFGDGFYITVSGGNVTANGGEGGAGIGGGLKGSGSDITVSGGNVTANGGSSGAGIGGGTGGDGLNITVSGGTVTATGGAGLSNEYQNLDGGSGIGGGAQYMGGYVSNIIISGGSVKAVAKDKDNAYAIGGMDANYNEITPTNGTNEVYLLTIANPYGEDVYIDGVPYSPVNHKAVDSKDGNLYAYLTGTAHSVKVGEKTCLYVFNSESKTFDVAQLAVYATNGGALTYGADYTYADGVLTIKSATPMTIANADKNNPSTDTIVVEKDVSANITFDGVNIDTSSLHFIPAFIITDNSTGNVTITLADGSVNTLKSGYMRAGLEKNVAFSQTPQTYGKLTIKGGTNGTGSLTATGGDGGAGIGGRAFNEYDSFIPVGKNITIIGGNVTANGGEGAAGIGGGGYSLGSDITVSGGTVTANGGACAAGIGGGAGGWGLNITVSGGTVTATGGARLYNEAQNLDIGGGSGIGGGAFIDQDLGGYASNIIISGGSVKAVAKDNAYAIGGKDIDGNEITPTLADGTTPVYLLEIANDSGADIQINDIAYPTNHNGEKKIYAYLPAKTLENPNNVAVGDKTTPYIYDEDNEKWLIIPTVTAPTANDLVYTGNEQALVTSGKTSGGTMVYSLAEDGEYSKAVPTGKDADTYNVWYKVDGGGVYVDTEPASVEVTITKANVTVTAESYTVKVNEALPEFEYKTAGLMGTDTLENIGANVTIGYENNANPSVIGNYKIVVSGETVTTNYNLNYVNGTLTITDKDVQTITADDVTLTYGDTGKKITAQASANGTISYAVKTGSDVISVTADGTITALKAGAATVEITAAEIDGYAKASKTVIVKVNKAAVTIKANNCTIKVGEALPEFGYSVTGLVNSEALGITPELTCEADTSKAGSYTITVAFGITEDEKYIYTVQNGTLNVQKKSTSTGGSGGSSGGSGGSSSTSTNPSIGGSEKSWSDVAADLSKLTTGSEATIELNGNTKVPVEVIKAIADKDSKVTFVINSTYAWVVDGADITAPATANLTLTKTSSTKHDGLRGIEGAQFRISDTGIPTCLEIAFKASHAGKFANLYKNVDGKLEFVTCAKLGADGKVILTDVTEKGEYIAMLCEYSDRPGDMDNDGILNPKDSYAVLKDFVGLENGKNPLVADLNNDGFINPKDAMIILKKYLGIE